MPHGSVLGGLLGASWKPLGASWGPLGGLLRASCGPLGGLLEASWGLLGALWPSSAILKASRGHLGNFYFRI